MADAKQEKNFLVKIFFDRKESTPFGFLSAESLAFVVSESVKDEVVDHFLKQESILTVNMSDSSIRYVNTRNILYIDVSEVSDSQATEVKN